MRISTLLLCFFLPFLSFSDIEELETFTPSTPDQFATLSSKESHLIGGLVSPLSGHLCLRERDLVVKGAQSLFLTRVYIPLGMPCAFTKDKIKQYEDLYLCQYLSKNYRGWQSFPHRLLKYNGQELLVANPNGAILDFNLTASQGTLSSPHFAICNLAGDEPGGAQDLRNTRVINENNYIIVHAPDGAVRFYEKRFKCALLQKEILPNGKILKYKYTDASELYYVESLDPRERFVYASIFISGSSKDKSFTSSSGQVADYSYQKKPFYIEIKEKIGKHTHKEVWDGAGPPLLACVKSPFYSEEKLTYSDKSLLTEYSGRNIIFSSVYGNFENQSRIHHLSLPVGDKLESVYEMHYQSPVPGEKGGWTEVKKTDGTRTIYHYTKECLPRSIQYFNGELQKEKIYTWTDNQWLKSLEIKDAEGKTFTKRTYDYDGFGNPIIEVLTGDLTGKGTVDSLTIKREFSQEGRNLLLKEEHENGKTLCFSYVPGTNLVTAKMTKEHDKTLIREFNIYDDCNNLIQKICDDGSGSDLEDITDVTERKETRITLKQEAPFLHMPEWIEETSFGTLLKRTHLVYDFRGNVALEEVYDADGNFAYSIAKEYNQRGDLLSETNVLGQKATYGYNTHGNCIKETNFSGRLQKERQFDALGRLCEEKEIGDSGICHRTLFEYDAYGRLIKKTDSFDQSTLYAYDPLVNQVFKTEFNGAVTFSTYDPFGRKTSHTDANGNTTRYRYNSYGSPIEITYANGAKEHFHYSKEGLLQCHTDPDDLTIIYSYDVLGRVISKDFGIAQETFTYNSFNLLSKKDKEGNVTRYTYDGAGRKIKEDASGHITESSYDALGRLSATCKQNGDKTLFTHLKRDIEGRIIEETKADTSGNVFYFISYAYDEDGNQAETTRSINGKLATSKTTYDAFGRVVEHKDPYSFTTTYTYNENYVNTLGQRVLQIKMIDPLGGLHVETQDVFHRPIKKEAYNDTILSSRELVYDAHGNLMIQKDHVYRNGHFENTQLIKNTYTSRHQLESFTQGDTTTAFTFTPAGKIASKKLPNESTLSYQYDCLGFLKTLSSSDETISHMFKHDTLGNLISAEDGNSSITRTVDSFGNVTEEVFSKGFTVNKEYDAFNRLTKLKIPSIGEVSYTYDPLYLRRVTRFSESGEELYTHHYESYDLNGNLECERLIDNLGHVSHKTDLRGKKTEILAPFFSESCSYDPLGNLVEAHIDETTQNYSYDGLSQLTKENSKTYAYDSLYNRDPVNDLNQLLSASYDQNGNQTVKQQYVLSYDALGRLVKATSSTQQIAFTYDPLGRRLSKTSGSETEHYLYNANFEIGAFDSKKLKSFRVLGLSTVAIELEGRPFAPLIDVQHNIRKLVDFSGSIAESYTFTAFGESLNSFNFKNPWRFASKRLDQELGLIYFGKRYYDPETARWLTPDPLGFIDSVNLYQYVLNNPFKYQDPDGRFLVAISIPLAATTLWQAGVAICSVAVSSISAPAIASAVVATAATYAVYYGASKIYDMACDIEYLSRPDTIMYQEGGTEVKPGRKKGSDNKIKGGPPRDKDTTDYLPDPKAEGHPHSTFGIREGKHGPYQQGATFENGKFTGRTDITDHGRGDHINPHYHPATSSNGAKTQGERIPWWDYGD